MRLPMMLAMPMIAGLAGCDVPATGSADLDHTNNSSAAVPVEERMYIVETRVAELEAALAAEKAGREDIDRQLAEQIAEVGQAALARGSGDVAQNTSAR